jgi:uncharacterized membrane protein YgdD (TMEM256/DUF423 family)
MERVFVVIGALSAFIAVAAGAYGSHGLKGRLTPEMMGVFEVGVRYQMYHALALIGVSFASAQWPGSLVTASGWLFLAGTILFSGSIYLLCLTGSKLYGPITPIGGGMLMIGWLCLAIGALK